VKFTELPPVETLRELFNYNPETGEVTWAISNSNAAPVGKVIKSKSSSGYVTVRINRKTYQLHRVIWKMFYGEEPGNVIIDHINRNKTDNRIVNLRLFTTSMNGYNRGLQSNSSTGVTGVHVHSDGFQVKVGSRYIGLFRTIEEAKEARENAMLQIVTTP
jgi:hypothetical protein